MKKLALIITAAFILSGVANAMYTGGDTDEATHNLTVNIPLFALVDVEDDAGAITLAPGVSQEAGDPLNFNASTATYSSAYLNYTSVVGSSAGGGEESDVSERRITADISSELNGKGIAIKVEAASYDGDGSGELGTSTGAQILSSGDEKTIVQGIGSCYTGDEENGHRLTYSLVQTTVTDGSVDYAALTSGSYDVTITYTITE